MTVFIAQVTLGADEFWYAEKTRELAQAHIDAWVAGGSEPVTRIYDPWELGDLTVHDLAKMPLRIVAEILKTITRG